MRLRGAFASAHGSSRGIPHLGSSAGGEVKMVHYRHMDVTGITIAYREAGRRAARTIMLLHGFPTSSHMYRELIPALADDYHVIAPDYPGFGYSDSPERETLAYTFDALAD